MKDTLFRRASPIRDDFKFDGDTADVFEDMLRRSIPFYGEIQAMTAELARRYAQDGSDVYDLGCSTGTTMLLLAKALRSRRVNIVGVDASPTMLEKARLKLRRAGVLRRCRLVAADVNEAPAMKNASVAVMNLTLHFVRPVNRERLLAEVHKGLRRGGCLILTEKIVTEDSAVTRDFVDLYHDFKARQGYSRREIERKREALENVLIPYRVEENRALLRRGGFAVVEEFFRWYNFCGLLAVKR
jgi:tRNA (cmo5U34)-methyltransferase